MAPVRYSLHYEDYSEHLMSRFGKLLQMQSLVDMTLMCSSHTLRVHKAVLAASSAYFQEVLQKQSGEPLIILKIRFSVLKSLVEFMYCGKTQCLEENLDELVSAAQFLKIKGLSKVTKEGLGITNSSELPAFTPPVVINRPPQSLINLQPQDRVVRLPFDMDKNGSTGATNVEYPPKDVPPRPFKPRRGRPSQRPGWEATGALGRAAERALLRREQDSRKAIHQLKHLQTRYSHQDYMDRVAIPQAVNSILPPESSTNHNYMHIDSDFMYMDQNVSSNVLNSNMPTIGGDTMTQSYPAPIASSTNAAASSEISSAMSQYVNALKNAGLPTDLPILFESGDGSYINVNEQVLLDMVQSSEIQYEVIEQPNIIENVADPSEIKSIDDLSKSIERGEMMTKSYDPGNNFDKDGQFSRHEDAINSLNAILPDNLDTFAEQQNYVVLDQSRNTSMVNNDFSGIDDNMQFFTKSMSDDVKKYYQGQQTLDQLCPTSTLDTSFSISLLDTKNPNLDTGHMGQQYSSLNTDDLRRQEDCYDFGLPLGQSNDFKGDDLDCLIQTPKRNDDDNDKNYNNSQERDDIINDLMNIEKNIGQNANENQSNTSDTEKEDDKKILEPVIPDKTLDNVFDDETSDTVEKPAPIPDGGILSAAITSSGIEWENDDIVETSNDNTPKALEEKQKTEDSQNEKESINDENQVNELLAYPEYNKEETENAIIDLTKSLNLKTENWGVADAENNILDDKENELTDKTNNDNLESTLEDNIPFAVGLCPLNQIQSTSENNELKRKHFPDMYNDLNDDAKCLRRKVKKKL